MDSLCQSLTYDAIGIRCSAGIAYEEVELWNNLCFGSSKERVATGKAETSFSVFVAFIL